MARRNIAEVLTGAVVLLVAAGFLAYAVANSGRSAVSGYTLYAKFDRIDGLGVGADVRRGGGHGGSFWFGRANAHAGGANLDDLG